VLIGLFWLYVAILKELLVASFWNILQLRL